MLRQTCEPESLFFEVPHLFAVHDEVAEFMRAVEARPCSVVFVCAEYDDRMVREGKGEGVDVCGLEGHPDDHDAVVFEEFDHVVDRPRR